MISSSPAAVPVKDASSALQIRHLEFGDLIDALRRGLADFNAAPTHAIFLSLIYPVVGLLLFRATFHYQLIPLLFPVLAGFAILGPFAAIGLYEISRLRERGEPVTWRNAVDVIHAKAITSILELGAVLATVFGIWIYSAFVLYHAIFGDDVPVSLEALIQQMATTRGGLVLFILGNLVGLAFALLAFTISVVSFPLMIDRDTDAATAALTSFRAVAANPVAMVQWGLIVVAALIAGSIPMLMGLAVVMPVLGHATWHLYRKVVV